MNQCSFYFYVFDLFLFNFRFHWFVDSLILQSQVRGETKTKLTKNRNLKFWIKESMDQWLQKNNHLISLIHWFIDSEISSARKTEKNTTNTPTTCNSESINQWNHYTTKTYFIYSWIHWFRNLKFAESKDKHIVKQPDTRNQLINESMINKKSIRFHWFMDS